MNKELFKKFNIHNIISADILLAINKLIPFLILDSLFYSFSMSYVYHLYAATGVFVFFAFQYLFSSIGFCSSFYIMYKYLSVGKLLFFSICFCCLGLILSSLISNPLLICITLTISAIGRGLSWGARQIIELNTLNKSAKPQYSRLIQSLSSILKIILPLIMYLILQKTNNNYHFLFLSISIFTIIGLLFSNSYLNFNFYCEKPNPLTPLTQDYFKKTSSFFIYEGIGNALRNALYISGVMTIVKQVSYFALIDSSVSFISAILLIYLSFKPLIHCIKILKTNFFIMSLAWIFLILSLYEHYFLFAFIFFYSLSFPMIVAAKQSIVLKALSSFNSSTTPQDNAFAREFLLLPSRLLSLFLAAFISHYQQNIHQSLFFIVILILFFMPLEYFSAKKIY